MEIKNLSDKDLLIKTTALVKRELALTLQILHHLCEIERHRLFSAEKCASLFTYCVEKLGYSEGSAQRRIQGMRALRELPEIEEKIASGILTLSNVAQAQSFLYQEKRAGKVYTKAKKLELFQELAGKSTRSAKKILMGKNSQIMPTPEVRVISEEWSELRITVDEEFLKDLERLKGLIAHKKPSATMPEILKYAMEVAIRELDPAAEKIKRRAVAKPAKAVKAVEDKTKMPVQEAKMPAVEMPASAFLATTVKVNTKAIPPALKREVWRRARGRCELCGSRHALQVDHIKLRTHGGENTLENFRLLCRHCNQRHAIEKLGIAKMEYYLSL